MRFSHILHGFTACIGAFCIMGAISQWGAADQKFYAGLGSGTVIVVATLWSSNYNAND